LNDLFKSNTNNNLGIEKPSLKRKFKTIFNETKSPNHSIIYKDNKNIETYKLGDYLKTYSAFSKLSKVKII
jgi:hypothetical protein